MGAAAESTEAEAASTEWAEGKTATIAETTALLSALRVKSADMAGIIGDARLPPAFRNNLLRMKRNSNPSLRSLAAATQSEECTDYALHRLISCVLLVCVLRHYHENPEIPEKRHKMRSIRFIARQR